MTGAPPPARPRRRLWWGAAAAGIAIATLGPGGCVSFGPPSTRDAFAHRPPPTMAALDLPGGRRLAWAETGLATGPLVVFVHGSPGSWDDASFVLADPRLAERARLIAIDRLGWGGSAAGGLEPRMADQARAVAAAIEAHPDNRPAIVVGHSLGGPVAARAAMDSPSLVSGLLLVAGSIDPTLEKTTWFQALGRARIVRWAVPEPLVRADDEIKPLRRELEEMLPLWGHLRAPVTVLQGEDDALVPAGNADFAERVITAAPLRVVRVPKQGHLIPWQRPDLIRDEVLRLLDRTATTASKGL